MFRIGQEHSLPGIGDDRGLGVTGLTQSIPGRGGPRGEAVVHSLKLMSENCVGRRIFPSCDFVSPTSWIPVKWVAQRATTFRRMEGTARQETRWSRAPHSRRSAHGGASMDLLSSGGGGDIVGACPILVRSLEGAMERTWKVNPERVRQRIFPCFLNRMPPWTAPF